MKRFEVGQTVRCVRPVTGELARGTYTVAGAGGWMVQVGTDTYWWSQDRFEAVEPEPALEPDNGTETYLPAPEPDGVYQPAHYARYAIEPITFIQANALPFDVGNVVKYVLRYDAKDGLKDLKKCRRYVDIIIETLERRERVKAGEDAGVVWGTAL